MEPKGVVAIAATLIVLMAGQTQAASFENGEELNKACRIDNGARTYGTPFCLGYIAGVVDSLLANKPEKSFGICFPHGVSAGTVADVVLKHLGNVTESRRSNGFNAVKTALQRAYPCMN